MTSYRMCDACGFTDKNVEAAQSWGKFSGSGVCLDLCPVCATIIKNRIRILREERQNAHEVRMP